MRLSHQVAKLILLAIHIKDQGICILLEKLYCYLKRNFVFHQEYGGDERNINPYSKRLDVV
jgi:hypothetical protein